jgi:alkaline phosphatase D
VERLEKLLETSGAKNVIILSGDRHISEFSEKQIKGVDYKLVDFTSSGMTHSYSNFSGEPNQYRVGEVVSDLSFGLLKFDFDTGKVKMEMRGEGNNLQQEYTVTYRD